MYVTVRDDDKLQPGTLHVLNILQAVHTSFKFNITRITLIQETFS